MLVAACKAPDGTYWAVQAWQRRLPLLGFDPCSRTTRTGSFTSRTSRRAAELEVYPNWTYDGRWQGVFGRYTYLGQPIYGFGANAKGVPKDKYGRNLYIDTLNSAYGPGGSASRGSSRTRARAPSATASCRSGRSPGYPSQEVRPAAAGERHRITVGGPGRDAVMQVELAGLTKADRAPRRASSTRSSTR